MSQQQKETCSHAGKDNARKEGRRRLSNTFLATAELQYSMGIKIVGSLGGGNIYGDIGNEYSSCKLVYHVAADAQLFLSSSSPYSAMTNGLCDSSAAMMKACLQHSLVTTYERKGGT